MSNVDPFRFEQLRHVSSIKSFSSAWPTWRVAIVQYLGPQPSAQRIFDLGGHLKDIFKSNVVTGRSNSAVASGGVAWECLVDWYLNLILYGTNVVCVKAHKKFRPSAIADALTIGMSNVQTNSETDLVAFNVPNALVLNNVVQSNSLIQNTISARLRLADINRLILANTGDTDVTVIQCKTNWNDNAQTPMLWDLIYASNYSFRINNVSVGKNGINPRSFNNFSYSFITVPTSRGPFTLNGMQVMRVKNLTGGNYWGNPTTQGVASAVGEFFSKNFARHFQGTVQQSIANNVLAQNGTVLLQFLDLTF